MIDEQHRRRPAPETPAAMTPTPEERPCVGSLDDAAGSENGACADPSTVDFPLVTLYLADYPDPHALLDAAVTAVRRIYGDKDAEHMRWVAGMLNRYEFDIFMDLRINLI